MKDGTVYVGDIVKQIPDSIVVLQLISGSVLVLQADDIQEAAQVQARFVQVSYYPNYQKKLIRVVNRGFFHGTSWNFYPRRRTSRRNIGQVMVNSGLTYEAGYRFSHRLGIGAGIGLEGYEAGYGMPLFVTVRGDLLPARVTPTAYARVGYVVSLGEKNNNFFWGGQGDEFGTGAMAEAGVGIKFRTRDREEWIMGLGYRYQQAYSIIWEVIPGPDFIWERTRQSLDSHCLMLHFTYFF